MTKFSVIIPVYNSSATIRRAVGSIIKQTYKNFECIIVDDGSNDSSDRICHELVKDDERFKLIKLGKNHGVACARNVGLNNISGDVVLWLDADDYFVPNAFESLLVVFQEAQTDIVIFDVFLENEKASNIYSFGGKSRFISKDLALEELCRDKRLKSWLHNKAISYTAFEKFRFDTSHLIYEDFALLPSIFQYARKIYYLDKALYHYVYNPRSLTHLFKPEIEIIKLKVIIDRIEKFKSVRVLSAINVKTFLRNLIYTMIRYGQFYNIIPFAERTKFEAELAMILKDDVIKSTCKYCIACKLTYTVCKLKAYRVLFLLYKIFRPAKRIIRFVCG